MNQSQGTLTPVPPFDFAKSLTFLGHFRPAMGEQHTHDGLLAKAIAVEGQAIVFQVRSTGSIAAPGLAYTLYAEHALDEAARRAVRERIGFFLSIDDDLEPFYAIGRRDPHFLAVIRDLYGYHQVKFLTPFENAVWAVLSQRNVMAVSRRMKDGLTERFGGSLEVDGALYRAFPEAAQLALLSIDEINAVVGNRWKSEGLWQVARAFDGVDEHWLRSAPYDEAEEWLRRIKGIGAWSSSFIMVRGLGRMERLPIDEKWLVEAARRWYGRPTLTSQDVARLAQPYGHYAGYWAHYLRAAT